MTVRTGDYELIYDPSVGEDERWYINDHTFFRDRSGTWHLIGITHAEPFFPKDEKHLAHATAPALTGPWTKHPYALSTDESAGETHLWAPHVIEHDDHYWMFVCAGGASEPEYRIHLATSNDGWEWTRHEANPLVVDGWEARDPMVVRIGDRWVMYYTATTEPTGGHHVVKTVESTDLVHWDSPRTVYTDELTGTYGGPTESPFVVERDGRWYLFIGPDFASIVAAWSETKTIDQEAYRTTRVLASDDPFAFRSEDQVATVRSHAAEVIIDEHGDPWVSHCGWGQGGVYLARLHWD